MKIFMDNFHKDVHNRNAVLFRITQVENDP